MFSSSRRTRYAMPGMSSPTGAYSRTRRPSPPTAFLIGSPIPCSICSSNPFWASPSSRAVSMATASERTLWLAKAGRTTSAASSICRVSFSYIASVSGLCVNTGTGQPSCAAMTVS